MEQIIRHFGRGIAAVAVALFLVAFSFGGADGKQGLLRMAGAAIKPRQYLLYGLQRIIRCCRQRRQNRNRC